MTKRTLLGCMLLVCCLLLVAACGGTGMAGTEWKASGYVDMNGVEQQADGTALAMSLAFFEGNSGALRATGISYTFTYEKKRDTLSIKLVDGATATAVVEGTKLLYTVGSYTLVFTKK